MKEEKFRRIILFYIINGILGILLVYELASMLYAGAINVAVKETRMSTKVIYDFLHGVNPYGAAWLTDLSANPPIYYESGFLHLLPSVALGSLFGWDCYFSATIVHIFYVMLAMLMMFVCVKRITNNITLGLLSSAIIYFCLNVECYTNVRPDTLCSLLIISIIYLIYLDADRNVEPDSLGKKPEDNKFSVKIGVEIREWGVALAAVLLIFLKIHYASIIFALFFVYLRRKRVWRMLVKGGILGILFVVITQLCFPTFFSTFLVRVIEMFRDNAGDHSMDIMIAKWKELFFLFPLPILFSIAGFILEKKRIWEQEYTMFLAINILFNFIALCFMGKWPGNGTIYHKTMIMSSIIIFSMLLYSNWMKVNTIRYRVAMLVLPLLILPVVFFQQRNCFSDFSSYSERIEARKAEIEELDQYRSGQMLLAPEKSFYALINNLYQWDYGDQIYLPYDIGTSPRWNFLFPYTNEYRRRNIEYGNRMIEMIQKQEYSLIITDTYNTLGKRMGLENDFQYAIEENYEKEKQEGALTYWVPIEDK